VTVLGGKWTTYRRMAEDAVNVALDVAGFEPRPCRTATLPLHGCGDVPLAETTPDEVMRAYGSDAEALHALIASAPSLAERLHPRLPYQWGLVIWAVRHEMARTVEDVLSRRTRSLALDARAAREVAPGVAAVLAEELGRDAAWVRSQVEAFSRLAERALPPSAPHDAT